MTYRSIYYGLTPAASLAEPDTGERFTVSALSGWIESRPVGASSPPRSYTVHDRDYCGQVVALFDEQSHPAGGRKKQAERYARRLNEAETIA